MYAVRGVAWRGVARRYVNRDIDRYLGRYMYFGTFVQYTLDNVTVERSIYHAMPCHALVMLGGEGGRGGGDRVALPKICSSKAGHTTPITPTSG